MSRLKRLVNAGSDAGWSSLDARRIRTTNIGALVGAASIGMWVPIAAATGEYVNAAENLFATLCFLSVPFINGTGRPLLAASVTALTTHLQLAWALYLFGFRSGSALFYSVLILGPYIVFPRDSRRATHAFAVLGVIAWVVATAVQDRLPQRMPMVSEQTNELLNTVLVAAGMLVISAGFAAVNDRRVDALNAERQRADALLLNVLPPSIAERLKASPGESIADRYDDVTILFADLVGFTPLSEQLSADRTVDLLNQIFTAFDDMCERAGVEKVRTIGDGYMAVCGAPIPRADHALVLARVAIEMRDYMASMPTGEPLEVRIGLNSGEAVAAIVGTSRFHFDLWGDAVNVAARMESLGEAGRIHIGKATFELISDEIACEPRGRIEVKGKGEMETWFIA